MADDCYRELGVVRPPRRSAHIGARTGAGEARSARHGAPPPCRVAGQAVLHLVRLAGRAHRGRARRDRARRGHAAAALIALLLALLALLALLVLLKDNWQPGQGERLTRRRAHRALSLLALVSGSEGCRDVDHLRGAGHTSDVQGSSSHRRHVARVGGALRGCVRVRALGERAGVRVALGRPARGRGVERGVRRFVLFRRLAHRVHLAAVGCGDGSRRRRRERRRRGRRAPKHGLGLVSGGRLARRSPAVGRRVVKQGGGIGMREIL